MYQTSLAQVGYLRMHKCDVHSLQRVEQMYLSVMFADHLSMHSCCPAPLQFNQLYEMSIDKSDKANMPSKRIHNIIEYMTYEIYLYIQVCWIERHVCLQVVQGQIEIVIAALPDLLFSQSSYLAYTHG
jgi:hypothetical protein